MIKVNVLTEEKSWSKKIKKKEIFFNQVCRHFPKKFKFINKRVYLTLLLSNNSNIKRLNKKFRKKDNHTDVLSFPLQKKLKNLKEVYLGDVIISFNYMNKPKNINNYDFKEKVTKIFIHGFLHLLNFNHIKEKEYQIMFREEQKIFRSVKKILI
tara:strand:- start:176 stop:637 length:462 start_codon:yes stop_codon:yes gene_type:complete